MSLHTPGLVGELHGSAEILIRHHDQCMQLCAVTAPNKLSGDVLASRQWLRNHIEVPLLWIGNGVSCDLFVKEPICKVVLAQSGCMKADDLRI